MPNIHIQQQHALGLETAKLRVNDIARGMMERLGGSYDWTGNTLHFHRSGAEATIAVDAKSVTVDVTLGTMMTLFKSEIERQIEGFLKNNLQ